MQLADSELQELSEEVTAAPDTELGFLYDKIIGMLNTNPDDARVRFLFAAVCNRARHYGLAKAVMDPLLHTHGQWGALRVNYGMTMDYLGNFEGALNQYRQAEKDAKVNKATLFNNRASVLIKMGRYEEADREAVRALEFNPTYKEAFINRGFARLAMGDLEQGWDNYDAAVGSKYRITIDYGVPHWKGEEGARLIVHGEQGIGDEIMYASCLPDAIARCEAVAYDSDAKLSKWMRTAFPGIKVVGSRKATERPWVAEFKPTHSIGIGSLPVLFRRSVDSFPRKAYLSPDPAMKAMYRALVLETDGGMYPQSVIGIAWSGGGPDTKEALREIPVEAFKPLIDKYPSAAFVSLQYREDAQAQIDLSGLPIQHHAFATGKGAGYNHTSAMIAACDRVISTDTTVIHAAGAMGVRTDCLLSTPCMWVHSPWHKDSSPWYPSVKLHRKPESFDWVRYINHLVSQGQL